MSDLHFSLSTSLFNINCSLLTDLDDEIAPSIFRNAELVHYCNLLTSCHKNPASSHRTLRNVLKPFHLFVLPRQRFREILKIFYLKNCASKEVAVLELICACVDIVKYCKRSDSKPYKNKWAGHDYKTSQYHRTQLPLD